MHKPIYDEIAQIITDEQPLLDIEKERIMHYLKKEINFKRRLFFMFQSLSAVTACFVLLVTVCTFNPVWAKEIPFMEHIIAFLKQERMPQSDSVTYGATERFTQLVDSTDENLDFRIMQSYCDGTLLVVSVVAEVETDESALWVKPTYNIAVNGDTILDNKGNPKIFSDSYTWLYRTENNRFIGSLAVDISNLNLTNTFTLTVNPVYMEAVNPYLQVLPTDAQSGQYISKSYNIKNTFSPYSADVEINTDIRSEYIVNQTIENFTLHEVITSPGFTYLKITMPEGRTNGYYYTVSDQTGTVLELMPNFAANSEKPYYEPIHSQTTEIYVHVYRWHDTTTPVGVITVPVTGGYDVQRIPTKFIDPGRIVYDPPLELASSNRLPYDFFAPQVGEQIVDLGEVIKSTLDKPIDKSDSDAHIAISFTNVQVYNSPADAGISDDDLLKASPSDTLLTQDSNFKFVTVDVHLENFGILGDQGADYGLEIDSYENNNGTAGVFLISSYVSAVRSLYEDGVYDPEYSYFSNHMTGPTNYDHFVMNEYDSRDFTVGLFVNDQLVESGEWYITTKVSRIPVSVGANTRFEQGFCSIKPIAIKD